jgi:hypothetical protein
MSTAPSSERISTQLGQKRGSRGRGVRMQPGGLQHQNSSARRGPRQAHDVSLDPWAAPRGRRLCAPYAAGRGEPPRARAPQAASDPACRRQGL